MTTFLTELEQQTSKVKLICCCFEELYGQLSEEEQLSFDSVMSVVKKVIPNDSDFLKASYLCILNRYAVHHARARVLNRVLIYSLKSLSDPDLTFAFLDTLLPSLKATFSEFPKDNHFRLLNLAAGWRELGNEEKRYFLNRMFDLSFDSTLIDQVAHQLNN